MPFGGVNFAQFVTDVKAQGVAEGFSYVTPDRWFDYELGVFPDSLKGQSFTIKLSNLTSHDEVEDWSVMGSSIEFVLSGSHDNYLSKLPDCLDAVRKMVSNVTDTSDQIRLQNVEDQKEFDVTYMGTLVAIVFDVTWIIDNRTSDEIS